MGRPRKHFKSYYERKTELFALIGGEVCRWCQSTESVQFDHIYPETKSFELSSKSYALTDEVIAEVLKCQPLCKKCHSIKSAREWAATRSPDPNPPTAIRTVASRAPKTPEQEQLSEEVRKELWENLGIRL